MGRDGLSVGVLLAELGVEAWPQIPAPPDDPPVRALSLAVAQKCNLGCTYCYAEQGGFGESPKDMPISTSLDSVRLLLADATKGDRVSLAFMGGEPLRNRGVLQETTLFAASEAARRGVTIGFSVTTNGTLLTKEDADFFEDHGFAVTVSLDGLQPEHDRLRSFVGGKGSYDLIMRRVSTAASATAAHAGVRQSDGHAVQQWPEARAGPLHRRRLPQRRLFSVAARTERQQ